MFEKGKIYEVEIVDLTDKGDGIGKSDGFTIFVEGAVPGDKVMAKLTKCKKNYAQGRVVEIIEKSDMRRDHICNMKECGGCQIDHIRYEDQLKIKKKIVEDAISRIGKLEGIAVNDTIGMEDPYKYRNKAQFPIGMKDGKTVTGFYRKGSHDIIACESCLIQHDVNDQINEIVRNWTDEFGIDVYDEKTHKGTLRHVVTKVGFKTGEVMVVIVTNGRKLKNSDVLVERLKSVEGLKTVVQNINSQKTNRIMGFENVNLYGDGLISDYIHDLKFNISPLSFFQVNPVQTDVLYSKALEYAMLSGNEDVFDIYCGIGTISLFLAQKAKSVVGIEIVEDAIRDARINAKVNGLDNTEFYAGKAEEVVPELYAKGKRADVVVVDPPRKGCDERVLETIVNMKPERVVYVSCNPSTLARDLAYLDAKGYKTVEVQPVDMFPHSMHVETVCQLMRKDLFEK